MAGCNGGEDFDTQEEPSQWVGQWHPCKISLLGTSVASHVKKETNALGKKYGGLVPKKKPLISKDNERAFFDSADWALGKQGANQGQKSRAVVETLRPKLQRTPHQQLPPRRPTCTSGRETMVD